MSDHYVLRNGEPVAVDLMTWAREFERGQNTVLVHTYLDHDGAILDSTAGVPRHYTIVVCTDFLGLNHNHWGSGPPILWETLAFASEPQRLYGGRYAGETSLDGSMRRYATREDALRGHAQSVATAQRALRTGFAFIDDKGEHWPEDDEES